MLTQAMSFAVASRAATCSSSSSREHRLGSPAFENGSTTGVYGQFLNGQLCDITLKADDTIIPAHKVVLAAQSAYLQAMFQVSHGRASMPM